MSAANPRRQRGPLSARVGKCLQSTRELPVLVSLFPLLSSSARLLNSKYIRLAPPICSELASSLWPSLSLLTSGRRVRELWRRQQQHRRSRRTQMEALPKRKRVMVVVDQTAGAKRAMMWALTHVVARGDTLTLLHVVRPSRNGAGRWRGPPPAAPPYTHLAESLGSVAKACRPEVEVEALVIEGPKLPTVLSQVKKLAASVLVLNQISRPSALCCGWFAIGGGRRREEAEFVEQCVERASCLAVAVRKQSCGAGGYLISTKWHKDFWLLA